MQALASSTDVNTDADDSLYDQPPPRKRKERDEESPPTREPPPLLGWHKNDTHSPPLYVSSTWLQEDGRNTSEVKRRPSRDISGSNGGVHGTDVKAGREEVEEEEEEEDNEEEEEEEEEEEHGKEAEPEVRGSRPRSTSLASSSLSQLPPGFFQEFDDMSSECEGCCRHANSIGEDGELCLDCCSHPPTEVCSSTPSPSSHPPVPSGSKQHSHRITPSRLSSFPPPSNLLRHNETPSPQQPVQRCPLAPQLEQLQSQVASNTKRIAKHDKVLVHHYKQIKENRQDILNHRGVLATMQKVMFLQREVDQTMSELKLQYLGDPDDLAGLSSASSTNGNESK